MLSKRNLKKEKNYGIKIKIFLYRNFFGLNKNNQIQFFSYKVELHTIYCS
jgi:hypothetical protein